MSSRTDAGSAETAAFLATVPLLEGIPEEELAELALIMRRRDVAAGEILWREGGKARELLLIIDGRVSVSLQLPGKRVVEITTVGSGELLGEIPLLDGGRHSATARAVGSASLLSLSHADYAGLTARRHPTAFALKQRLAVVACSRLRLQLAALTESLVRNLSDEPATKAAPPLANLEFCGPPNSGYVRRLATFHDFDSLALWGFLTAGRYARCPPGRSLIAEGTHPPACYLTINGAVEKIIVRGGRRIRVGLAGPGQAFGYESLIDGGPAPMTSATHERTLLLMLPKDAFERLFYGETHDSHVFIDVIHRDLAAALRQALRPHARLAASF